jgi:surface polysaccharide O-acyltransferase-like enzyme
MPRWHGGDEERVLAGDDRTTGRPDERTVPTMTERLSTDLLRVIAMGFVVLIHATAPSERAIVAGASWLSLDGLAVALNQLGRFCVPVFVALSGYGLAARHLAGKRDGLLAFAGERMGRILLPYLCISLAVFAVAGWPGGVLGTLEGLARGRADYHLYFIPLILCCYACFPLLIRVDSRTLWWGLLLVLLGFSSPAHKLWEGAGLRLPALDGWVPHAWLFWFYHGIRLAYADQRGDPRPGRWTWVLALITGIAVVGDFAYWATVLPEPGWFDHFHRWVVVAYGLAVLAAWRAWRVGAGCGPRGVAVIGALAGWSFTVYLAHTWVLRVVERSPLAPWPLAVGVATLGLTVAAAWVLSDGVPGRWLRRAAGLGDGQMVKLSKAQKPS